jgi:ribosomal protein L7/L12
MNHVRFMISPELEVVQEALSFDILFKDMSDQKIEVIAYSGYRDEETPRVMILHNKKIEVVKILSMWVEEGLDDRARKRFFKVKGSDGNIHKIYYAEKARQWFYRVE